MTATASGSSSAVAVLKPATPSIATTSTASRQAWVRSDSQVVITPSGDDPVVVERRRRSEGGSYRSRRVDVSHQDLRHDLEVDHLATLTAHRLELTAADRGPAGQERTNPMIHTPLAFPAEFSRTEFASAGLATAVSENRPHPAEIHPPEVIARRGPRALSK